MGRMAASLLPSACFQQGVRVNRRRGRGPTHKHQLSACEENNNTLSPRSLSAWPLVHASLMCSEWGDRSLEDSPIGSHRHPSALLLFSVSHWTWWASAPQLQSRLTSLNLTFYSVMFPATAPSVEVFQPSNRDHFTLGKQLKKLVIMTITWLVETAAEMNSSGASSFLFLSILTDFISRQWNRVANQSMGTPAKSRDSWFKPRGTIKNIHATLNVWIPQSKYATSECILADWSCFWAWVLWSGPATFRRLPAEKRSFYQQWSWIASQTTQAHTLSRTLRGSSSPTPPVERSGFLLEFRQIQMFPTSLAIYDSFTEGDGLCGQISSTSRCQTAGGVAFLLTGHWTL